MATDPHPSPAGFPMAAIEAAERRIRDAFRELYGSDPSVEFVRDQARRLLTEELADLANTKAR